MDYPTIDWDFVEKDIQCATCKETFREINNIGRWNCRMHPGEVEDGAFSCCGLKTIYESRLLFMRSVVQPELRGCVRCDHRGVDDQFSGKETVIFPENYLIIINPKRAAVERPPYAQPPGTARMLLCHRIMPVAQRPTPKSQHKKM